MNVLKQLITTTGASLFEAKVLYDKILKEEAIKVNPIALELQA